MTFYKTKSGSLYQKLENFFFAPLRQEPMAIARVFFGLSLFFHYADLWSSVQFIFGPEGFVSFRQLHIPDGNEISREKFAAFKILRQIHNPDIVFGLFLLLLASSLSFAAGFFTRTSGVLALLLHSQFHGHNEFAFWGWGALIKPFMFYVICSRAGDWYSVDAWIKNKKWRPTKEWLAPAWPQRLLQIHVTTVYFIVAWWRVDDPNWLAGDMLYGILVDPLFGRINSDWREFMGVLRFLCYAAWSVELMAPIALWTRTLAKSWVWLLFALHIGLEVLTKVGYWNFIMIGALTVFLFNDKSS